MGNQSLRKEPWLTQSHSGTGKAKIWFRTESDFTTWLLSCYEILLPYSKQFLKTYHWCARNFIHLISSNFPTVLWDGYCQYSLSYRWEDWGSEKLNNLLKVIPVACGKSQSSLPGSCFAYCHSQSRKPSDLWTQAKSACPEAQEFHNVTLVQCPGPGALGRPAPFHNVHSLSGGLGWLELTHC